MGIPSDKTPGPNVFDCCRFGSPDKVLRIPVHMIQGDREQRWAKFQKLVQAIRECQPPAPAVSSDASKAPEVKA